MIRAVFAFIAGVLSFVVIAMIWMPRATWVELLDHVDRPWIDDGQSLHLEVSSGHTTSFVRIPVILNHNAKIRTFEYPGFGDIHLFQDEPIFRLSPDVVKTVCFQQEREASLFTKARTLYGVYLLDEVREQYLTAIDTWRDGDDFTDTMYFVGGRGLVNTTGFADFDTIRNHRRDAQDDPPKPDFRFPMEEPYLEAGLDLMTYFNGDKAPEACPEGLYF